MALNPTPANVLANLGSSATFAAVTPHDSTDLAALARGLYVGVTGDVAVVDNNGTAVTFVGVPAGTVLPVAARRVNSTNTTATDIVALF